MAEIMDAISLFFSGTSVIVYVSIFLGKILEVTLGTLRMVLVNRGERLIGALMALIEIILWLVIAGSVLADRSDILKLLAYALAYACGNFLGGWVEEKLAFGLCSIQCILMNTEGRDKVSSALRAAGYAVTELATQGMDGAPRFMLLCTVRRKLANDAIALIQKEVPGAVITVSDVKSQKGGYLRQVGNRRKSR